MGRLPKRLQHGEGATVVDHLEELRWRIIIVLGALALTRLSRSRSTATSSTG
jgi:hypothetical protein